jgi:putative component of membrane protein insertase Oxa1/YidC/SpoIIIJ protein YidD
MKKVGVSVFCYLLLSITTFAQTPDEIKSMRIQHSSSSESIYIDSSRINNSEYDFVAGLLFRFYKSHISSQDIGSCVFQPSCSEYALLAIKKQGLIIGSINFFDRLTRCNKNTSEYYPIKAENGLRPDPVRNIFYEEK